MVLAASLILEFAKKARPDLALPQTAQGRLRLAQERVCLDNRIARNGLYGMEREDRSLTDTESIVLALIYALTSNYFNALCPRGGAQSA